MRLHGIFLLVVQQLRLPMAPFVIALLLNEGRADEHVDQVAELAIDLVLDGQMRVLLRKAFDEGGAGFTRRAGRAAAPLGVDHFFFV